MAPIRKAKGYVTYLIALFVTGLFGLFHKTPPAWADAIESGRNAMVFRSMYLAQNTETPTKSAPVTAPSQKPSWPSQGMDISKNKGSWPSQGMDISKIQGAWPSQGMDIAKSAPESSLLASPEVQTKIDSIGARIRSGDSTTTQEELSFYLSFQNAAKLEVLSNQINLLLMKLNSLEDKCPSN